MLGPKAQKFAQRRAQPLDIDHANEFRAEGPTDHRIEGPGRGEVLARWAERKVLWKSQFSRALPFPGSTAGPSARIPFSNTPEKKFCLWESQPE